MNILPVFLPHQGCVYNCIYCNQHIITKIGKPDLSKISKRIENFCKNNSSDKEVAFYGGTYTNLSRETQIKLFKLVEPFFAEINGIRISTRPDCIDEDILDFCKKNHVSTIELGIQSFSNNVLKASHRFYSKKTVIKSTKLIKQFNFNLGIQLMPGLPASNDETINETIWETINLHPDLIRIYPTIVLKNTELEKEYYSGSFKPLSLEKAIAIAAKMKKIFVKSNLKVIKIGLHSDISQSDIVAGPYHPSFGELVKAKILSDKIINEFQSNKTLVISPKDISLFRGFDKLMLNSIKKSLYLLELPISFDSNLTSDNFYFSDKKAAKIW